MNVINRFYFAGPTEKLVLCLALSPIWWLLGLNLVVFHVFSFVALYQLRLRQGRAPLSVSQLFLFGYIVIYFISLSVAAFSADISRVVASFYNFTYWLMGLSIVYVVVNDSSEINFDELRVYIKRIVYFISILAVVVFLFLLNRGEVAFSSLLGVFIPLDRMPPLIGKSMTVQLLSQDWFSGEATPRLSIMSPYATAYGILIIMLMFLGSIRKVDYVLIFLGMFLVMTSLSRMALVFYIIFLISLPYSMLHSSLRRWSVALFLMLLVVSGTLMFGYIQEAWVNFNAYRQGSSDLRMLIYSMSWDIAMEQGPYIGLGVKPREEYLVPIGSHSTLVGSVLKTGLFGFLFLLLFYMSIFLRALKYIFYGKSEGVLLGMACLVLMVYSGFADVDAPQLVSFLFFMIIGMLFRRESYERNI